MSRITSLASAFVLTAFSCVSTFAEDVIVLTNGINVKGTIVSVENGNAVINTQGNEMTWPLSNVHKITAGGETKEYNPLKEVTPVERKPVPPPEKTETKTPPKSSGKTEPAPAKVDKQKVLAMLNGKPQYPSWLKEISNTPNKPAEPFWTGRASFADMQQTAGQFFFLANQRAGTPQHPYWLLQLAIALADTNNDSAAYYTAGQVGILSELNPIDSSIDPYNKYQDIKFVGSTVRGRILARNGVDDEVLQQFVGMLPTTGYEQALMAEALAMGGHSDAAKQMLEKAYANRRGHIESNWSDTMIGLRVVAIARGLGDDVLTQKYSGPFVSQGYDAQKWPHWKAAWSIMKKIEDLCKAGKHPVVAKIKAGTYEGTSNGFDGPVKVAVTVAKGKITAVKVVEVKDGRPRSAVEVIPVRIVQAQSPFVDAVTGATMTSTGIVTAVDDALSNAPQQ